MGILYLFDVTDPITGSVGELKKKKEKEKLKKGILVLLNGVTDPIIAMEVGELAEKIDGEGDEMSG